MLRAEDSCRSGVEGFNFLQGLAKQPGQLAWPRPRQVLQLEPLLPRLFVEEIFQGQRGCCQETDCSCCYARCLQESYSCESVTVGSLSNYSCPSTETLTPAAVHFSVGGGQSHPITMPMR